MRKYIVLAAVLFAALLGQTEGIKISPLIRGQASVGVQDDLSDLDLEPIYDLN